MRRGCAVQPVTKGHQYRLFSLRGTVVILNSSASPSHPIHRMLSLADTMVLCSKFKFDSPFIPLLSTPFRTCLPNESCLVSPHRAMFTRTDTSSEIIQHRYRITDS
ncbi:hypothetical protein JB92DRAFT_2956551, partial [Gautieria morchelliformis]